MEGFKVQKNFERTFAELRKDFFRPGRLLLRKQEAVMLKRGKFDSFLKVATTLVLWSMTPVLEAHGPATAQASWENVGNLARGDEVKVVVSHGSAQRGVFQRVAGETMVVHLAAGDQTFERQNVTEILAKREGHRGRHAAIGLLVGAGAGLGIG